MSQITPTEAIIREKQPLQYPLEDSRDYNGRIKFRVIEEQSADLSKIANEAKSFGQKTKDALSEFTSGGGTEQSKAILNQFKGTANAAFSTAPPKKFIAGREVSLYLPVGLQFRDNVGYENVELLSGQFASGVAATQALSGSGSNEQTKLALLGLSQKNQGTATLARAGSRVTTNPNTRALFKTVNLREFAFTFKFIPKSRKEAEEVKQIIQLFREELYPESIRDTVLGTDISIGFRFPNRFQIDIEYNGEAVTNKILPCYLRDVSVSYNPTQMAMHEDGNFSEIDMSLSFTESRTLDRREIEAGF